VSRYSEKGLAGYPSYWSHSCLHNHEEKFPGILQNAKSEVQNFDMISFDEGWEVGPEVQSSKPKTVSLQDSVEQSFAIDTSY